MGEKKEEERESQVGGGGIVFVGGVQDGCLVGRSIIVRLSPPALPSSYRSHLLQLNLPTAPEPLRTQSIAKLYCHQNLIFSPIRETTIGNPTPLHHPRGTDHT